MLSGHFHIVHAIIADMACSRILRTLFFFCVCTPAMPDQITFSNGDRLSGMVLKSDSKIVVIKSDVAGEITVPWEKVATIESSEPLYVGLKDGQVVTGDVSLKETSLQVQTQSTGVVSAPREVIDYIHSKQVHTEYETEIERYRNPRLTDLWVGFVDFGYSSSRGNARTSTINTAGTAARATSRDKITVHFTSLYASNSTTGVSLITANALRGGINYSLNVTPNLFAFGSSDLEYDEFQSLDLRFVPAGGFGYKLWKSERGQFNVFGGASMNQEFFSTGVQRTSAEGLFGEELLLKVNSRMALRHRLSNYPNMTNPGEYRLNVDLSAETALWRWFSWQFTVNDRFLSNPVMGRQKNDLVFTTGLRLSFAK
jgi:putative salt-induced outer membrane protein